MFNFKAAWKAFNETPPQIASDRLDLESVGIRRDHWAGFKTIAFPATTGIVIISAANLWETLNPPSQTHETTVAGLLRSQSFLLHLTIEIGVAFLVAAIVSFFVERRSRGEQTRLLEEAIKLVGNEVVQGVYGVRHAKDYVKAVVSSCLAVRHTRKGYEVNCHLSEFSPEECDEIGINAGSLIKLVADVKYDALNIGDRELIFEGRYSVPKRSEGIGAWAGMTFLEIGGRAITGHDLAALEIQPDDPSYVDSDRSYRFEIPTRPGLPTRVRIKAQMAKERSDNEIFTFLLPTTGAKIRFHFQVPRLVVGAKARTASVMSEPDIILPNKEVIWEVPGPILPNNHMTVWWREPPEDGQTPQHGNDAPQALLGAPAPD